MRGQSGSETDLTGVVLPLSRYTTSSNSASRHLSGEACAGVQAVRASTSSSDVRREPERDTSCARPAAVLLARSK